MRCGANWSSVRLRLLGFRFGLVPLPWPCSNEQYEALMAEACAKAVAEGIEGVAFGDLFLEDVRAYREKQMKDTGLEPVFPVWGLPTRALAEEMIASGMRAKLTCVDTEKLDRSFVGASLMRRCLRICLWKWILRRTWGISFFCLCGAYAEGGVAGFGWRDCGARSVCFCGFDLRFGAGTRNVKIFTTGGTEVHRVVRLSLLIFCGNLLSHC